jgi:tetratricopeptide (TPR) repeat protein
VTTAPEDLLDLADTDPEAVLADTALLAAARRRGDLAAAATVLRAKALAAAALERLDESVTWVEQALESASASGDAAVAGGVEMSAGAILVWAGRTGEGIRLLDRASHRPGVGGRALVQRVAVEYRLGDYRAALEAADLAAATLGDGESDVWWSRLHTNVALVLAAVGRMGEARDRLERARGIDDAAGRHQALANDHHNLAWVSAVIGDLPAAFHHLDRASELAERLGMAYAEMWRDRADALLAAGFTDEAVEAARAAVERLRRGGHVTAEAEAQTRLAECLVEAGDGSGAAKAALEAVELFRRQGREGWAAYARFLHLSATSEAAGAAAHPVLVDLAAELGAWGFHTASQRALVLAGRLALAAGDVDGAHRILSRVDPNAMRPMNAVALGRAWTELEVERGDLPAAARAAAGVLRTVDAYRAELGSSEARAQASRHTEAVVAQATAWTVGRGRPRDLFDWIERGRAASLRLPRVLPPSDPEMAGMLAELRTLERRLRVAGEDREGLVRRRARLEGRVRRRARRLRGEGGSSAPGTAGDVLDRLDGATAMASVARVGDRLVGVVLFRGRAREVDLGVADRLAVAVADVRRSLQRLARDPRAPRVEVVARALQRLTPLSMLAPEGAETLVVSLPGEIATVPWALVPGLWGMGLALVPSAAHTLGVVPSEPASLVAVSGPRLSHADEEARMVASAHGSAVVLAPPASTVDATRDALERHRVAHVVAHGSFRADSPYFSSLELSDGQLYLYELERLERLPNLLVLSACDLGATTGSSGEPVGVVTAMLAAGVESVVASPVLVPDDLATAAFFGAFHSHLARGHSPAQALRRARRGVDRGDPGSLVLGAVQTHGRW